MLGLYVCEVVSPVWNVFECYSTAWEEATHVEVDAQSFYPAAKFAHTVGLKGVRCMVSH
jgi:hypothetical protein